MRADLEICGLPMSTFLPLFLVVLICTYAGFMPVVNLSGGICMSMPGTLAFLMSLGGAFYYAGGTVPVLSTYMGGSALLCLFAPAFMNYFGFIPEAAVRGVEFLMRYGLQEVYIATLLCGSVFCMDRMSLLESVVRYVPAILGSQAFAMILCMLAGSFTGYGAASALFYIGAPAMSGGSGGALVTIPRLYSELSGRDCMEMSGIFLCYVSISNVIAIMLSAGAKPLMSRLGLLSPDGSPSIMRGSRHWSSGGGNSEARTVSEPACVCGGIFLCLALYMLGGMLGRSPVLGLVPGLAWSIIISVVLKCSGALPARVECCAVSGMDFMLKGLLPAIIAGIGINSINMEVMISHMSVSSFVVIAVTVAGAFLGAALFGHLCGLYGYEAGITAGLCCCNTGGSGDLAVLEAGGRTDLLAFAAISTRIGGALMVVWTGILYRLLML